MPAIKRYFQSFLDVILWTSFLLYVIGGIQFGARNILAYPKDFIHAAIILSFLGLALKVDLTQLTFVAAFIELGQNLERKKLKPKNGGGWVILVSSLYLIFLFIITPLVRHWSYGTWRWDLGAIEQIIWRGAHGLGFTSTIILNAATVPLNFIKQQHLELWLIPASLIYRVFPQAETLILLQSLALIGCLIPLWKIARILFPATVTPMIVVAMFWGNENLHRVNIWDVHENAFIPFFSLWACYFFLKRKWLAVIFFTLMIATFKEDAWVIAGGMAGYFLITRRRYSLGVLAAGFGFGAFLMYGSLFTVRSMALSDRYAYLGNNLHEAATIVKRRPWIFIEQLLSRPNLILFRNLILVGGGTWLASGWALLTVASVFFEIALSTYAPARSLNGHYLIALMGLLFFCICSGLGRLTTSEIWRDHQKTIISTALLLSLWPLEYSEPANVKYMLRTEGFKNRHCYDALINNVPPEAPVYANDPFTTRLANRAVVLKYEKGTTIDYPGSYVIFEEGDPTPTNTQLLAQSCGYKISRLKP